MTNRTMKTYFAYGSNMWNDQMSKRCPQSKKLGNARLLGYRWIISKRGYANVVKADADAVEGVLFEISDSDERELDRFEGVSSGSYRKENLSVSTNTGHQVALVYVDPIAEEGMAKQEYFKRINAGVSDARLSEDYVERVIRRFIPA